jgi:hypothetical protein
MAIRKRGSQSQEDTHIRAALTVALRHTERQRDDLNEFGGSNDAELMNLDLRIDYYKRKLADEGNYSLVTR